MKPTTERVLGGLGALVALAMLLGFTYACEVDGRACRERAYKACISTDQRGVCPEIVSKVCPR